MTHKIFTSSDRALEEHLADPLRIPYKTHRERMLFDFNRIASPLRRGLIAVWNGVEGTEHPIKAIVNGGRWVARCGCGGQENVDPDDPIFFCHECGNKISEGKSRPVIFPSKKKREQIEAELLKIEIYTTHISDKLPPSQRSAAANGERRRDWEGE